jgi:hypothetical protein
MAQGVIRSPIDINVQERKVAILLRLHGKLNIPVKAIQILKQSPHLFWSVWPDDKGIILITSCLRVACFKSLFSKSPIKTLKMTGESVEPITTPSVCS